MGKLRDIWRTVKGKIDADLALLGKGWTDKNFKEDLGPTLDKLEAAAADLKAKSADFDKKGAAFAEAKYSLDRKVRDKAHTLRAPVQAASTAVSGALGKVNAAADAIAEKATSYRTKFEEAVRAAKASAGSGVAQAAESAIETVLKEFAGIQTLVVNAKAEAAKLAKQATDMVARAAAEDRYLAEVEARMKADANNAKAIREDIKRLTQKLKNAPRTIYDPAVFAQGMKAAETNAELLPMLHARVISCIEQFEAQTA
jgi:chromosome segregation ATPase